MTQPLAPHPRHRTKSARVAVVQQVEDESSDEEREEEGEPEVADEEILADLPDDIEVRAALSPPTSTPVLIGSFGRVLPRSASIGNQLKPLSYQNCLEAKLAAFHAVEETVLAAEPYLELGPRGVSAAHAVGGVGVIRQWTEEHWRCLG